MIKSVLITIVLFFVGAAVWEVDILPISDSILATYLATALVALLAHTVFGIVVFIPITIVAYLINETLKDGVIRAIVIFIIASAGFATLIALPMVYWIPRIIEWFPQFSYWQYVAILAVSSILGYENKESK